MGEQRNLYRCENGHYYDADKFVTCPHCEAMKVGLDTTMEHYKRVMGNDIKDTVTESRLYEQADGWSDTGLSAAVRRAKDALSDQTERAESERGGFNQERIGRAGGGTAGIYFNPGSQRFSEAVHSKIYVDQTEMILHLNSVVCTEQKYVSVSRPHRFGKSIAANMLSAYYGRGDSRSLFGGMKLAGHDGWDQYLNQFDVIHLVMTDFFEQNVKVEDALNRLTERLLEDLEEACPDVKYDPADLCYSMEKLYRKTNTQFVIIIDEWDAVFRTCKEDREGQTRYLDFLRKWLKDKRYVALAYMTGILPVRGYGEHSALNMFEEYSAIFPMQFAPVAGFTEEEVRKLCNQYGCDYDKLYVE